MAAQEPQSDRDLDLESADDKDRERRDLLLFLLILLLGFICLLCTAQMAIRPDRAWKVPVNMLSEMNPNGGTDVAELPLEPLRSEVMTPPSWSLTSLAPGTPVIVPVATFALISTVTPTPQAVVVGPTPSPSVTSTPYTPTPTGTPTGTPTPTPTPTTTPTPTSTPTPSPTSTATNTPTPTSTNTSTPTPTNPPPPPPPTNTNTPTPTDTPTPTNTPTPTSTFTPTPTPIPPPTVLSITPNEGCNDADVTVVIRGSDFLNTPTLPRAWLGNVEITIFAATTDTLTGTVPAGIAFGAYALTVQNPDGQSDTLPSAYTVVCPSAPLETGYLVTFGPTAPVTEGDDDHQQEIFFHIPSYTGTLYIRIFDADTGGANDEIRGGWDTTIRYTLFGSSVPPQVVVIGSDPAYDDQWVSVFGPYQASDLIDGNGVFSLLVEGVSSDDGNIYNVAVSTDAATNTSPPGGGRIFAYSWTFPVYTGTTRWLYPYVPSGTISFEQYNFDMDLIISMILYTPTGGTFPVSNISGDGVWASSSHPVASLEDGSTWSVSMDYGLTAWSDATFRATGDGAPLAIFTAPTTSLPP